MSYFVGVYMYATSSWHATWATCSWHAYMSYMFLACYVSYMFLACLHELHVLGMHYMLFTSYLFLVTCSCKLNALDMLPVHGMYYMLLGSYDTCSGVLHVDMLHALLLVINLRQQNFKWHLRVSWSCRRKNPFHFVNGGSWECSFHHVDVGVHGIKQLVPHNNGELVWTRLTLNSNVHHLARQCMPMRYDVYVRTYDSSNEICTCTYMW